MRGRKPTPTHLKLVRGNPGKRPLNESEPKPTRERPSAPAHLSDRAREAWGYVSGVLDRMGILTEADTIAVEMLCEAYADYLEARETLKKYGSNYYETTSAKGGTMLRSHPAVAVMQDADRRIKAWTAEFGMTASARSRVQVNGQEEADPADRFFGS
jgi:P27 family predicted phage terminase small subunit